MILISDDEKLLSKCRLGFPITRNSPEWLSPLLAIIPGQIFAMQLAIEKDLNPDSPTGLTKVTSTL
jgi:glutamine---fructose-6-phosphate transaminase (isomerizing)